MFLPEGEEQAGRGEGLRCGRRGSVSSLHLRLYRSQGGTRGGRPPGRSGGCCRRRGRGGDEWRGAGWGGVGRGRRARLRAGGPRRRVRFGSARPDSQPGSTRPPRRACSVLPPPPLSGEAGLSVRWTSVCGPAGELHGCRRGAGSGLAGGRARGGCARTATFWLTAGLLPRPRQPTRESGPVFIIHPGCSSGNFPKKEILGSLRRGNVVGKQSGRSGTKL